MSVQHPSQEPGDTGGPKSVAVVAAAEPIPTPPTGERWGDASADDRKAHLAARYRAWLAQPGTAPGPFVGERLTGADVFFLAASTLADIAGVEQPEEHLRAAMHDAGLRGTLDLSILHLDGADLQGADLRGAALGGVHLSGANLWSANLLRACLQSADLSRADLDQADLRVANLERARMRGAKLSRADLGGANLNGANLRDAVMKNAILVRANLEGAHLRGVDLGGANLAEAYLTGAFLAEATAEGANFEKAHLAGANFTRARLEGANMRLAVLDKGSHLNEAHLDRVALAHASFNGCDMTTVYWDDVRWLGDEVEARRPLSMEVVQTEGGWRVDSSGKRKLARQHSREYVDAARAYRALAVELRAQGLARDARRMHYRGQLMDRAALLHELFARFTRDRLLTVPLVFGQWLFSWLLGTLGGYGDYLGRLFGTYVAVVMGFALAFVILLNQPLTGPHAIDALVLSITAFHGHGLAAPGVAMTRAIVWLSGIESFIGLVIEGLFVAVFTRRLMSS
jgi:uncharacterized protein YjbI with pentapeptide repeats